MPEVIPLNDPINDAAHFGQQVRFDNQASVFFSRELEAILPEVVQVGQPALNFLDLIPTRAFPMGAQSITFKSAVKTGKADFIGPASGDIPSVNIEAAEDTVRYKTIGVAVRWSWEEMQAAQYAQARGVGVGLSLERDGLIAARRAIEELVNRVAWYGDKGAGLLGLVRQPLLLGSDAANALGSASTADQCIAVLNAGANAIPNNTEQVETANTLLLPPDSYQYVAQQIRSTASDSTTLDFWLRTNGYVTAAQPVRELSNAEIMVAGVPSTSDVAIFYRRDPSILELPYSGIMALPPQQQGLNHCVILLAKVGGLMVKRPRAIHMLRGV